MLFKKTEHIPLNGMDCLMTAFDYHMKKSGFAGNLAQMVLKLPVQIAESDFRERILHLVQQFPIIHAPSRRNFFTRLPYWEIDPDRSTAFPGITAYHLESDAENSGDFSTLKKKLFNLPLQPEKGEQIRFDLIYFAGGGMEIYMTWVHALMDAQGAEYFFSMIGNPGLAEDAFQFESSRKIAASKTRRKPKKTDSADRWGKIRQSFDHIDEIALNPPVSILSRLPETAKSSQEYRIVSFSRNETRSIMELSGKRCGLFNESTCFAAAVMCELKKLYEKKRVPSGNYVLSLPVNLRKKGTCLPIFSNQSTSLLYSFHADCLTNFSSAARHFKEQTQRAIRTGLLDANVAVMEVSKFLPAWFYIKKVRQAMKGEIASIVFANPGLVHGSLTEFMGIPVDDVRHMPAIIAPPGIGVLFYRFSQRLNITFVYTEGILSREEKEEFQQGIRSHLFNER